MAINSVVIVGRLTRDIELRQAGETEVANFTLAVDKPYNKDNEHPEANWIDCVAWGKTAAFLEKYFSKGNRVGITGSLQTRNYENKDGVKVKVTEVNVNTVDFIERKSNSDIPKDEAPEQTLATDLDETSLDESTDDEPF
jgi:single-strand DNA-binding protein